MVESCILEEFEEQVGDTRKESYVVEIQKGFRKCDGGWKHQAEVAFKECFDSFVLVRTRCQMLTD